MKAAGAATGDGRHEPSWRPGPADLPLVDGEVHVWRACVAEVGRPALDALEQVLTAGERRRVARLRRRRDRVRAVLARGGARLALGAVLGTAPGTVELRLAPNGKPEVAAAGGRAPPARFNCSHSGDVVLVAVTRSARVGVDVEAIRPLVDLLGVAHTVCAPAELRALDGMPAAEAEAAFFRVWCRKEAYLKAVGAGLTRSAAGVCVAVGPAPRRTLLAIDGDGVEAAGWTLLDLPAGSGHAAALAVEGRATTVRLWRLEIGGDPVPGALG